MTEEVAEVVRACRGGTGGGGGEVILIRDAGYKQLFRLRL